MCQMCAAATPRLRGAANKCAAMLTAHLMQVADDVFQLVALSAAACNEHPDGNDGHQQQGAERQRDGLEKLFPLGGHKTARCV